MPKFSALAEDLKGIYCLPSVRQGVIDAVSAIRRGTYRVHGMSTEGMDHIFSSAQCHFRALYLVSCEHCDHGELHYPIQRSYHAGDEDSRRNIIQEMFSGVYRYAQQEFGDVDFIQVDPQQIVFQGQVVVGALTFQDDDEPHPRTVIFGPSALPHKQVLTMIYGGLSENLSDDDEAEDVDDGEQ